MFVYASNLDVLFSTFAGFALLFCIKVVAEGEVVIEYGAAIESKVVKSRREMMSLSRGGRRGRDAGANGVSSL